MISRLIVIGNDPEFLAFAVGLPVFVFEPKALAVVEAADVKIGDEDSGEVGDGGYSGLAETIFIFLLQPFSLWQAQVSE